MATTILILVLCSSWLLVWVQLSQNRSRRNSTFRISRRTSFWPNKCLIVVRAEVNSSLKRRQLSSFFFFLTSSIWYLVTKAPCLFLAIKCQRDEWTATFCYMWMQNVLLLWEKAIPLAFSFPQCFTKMYSFL